MSMSDLIDYEPSDVPMNMEIRTEKITPINSSAATNTFKFEILQVGYLDSNSMLTFKANSTTGNASRANCWNGGLGAVKRVRFLIGDFEVCDFQELDRLSTMLNMNVPPATRNNFMGHFIGNQFVVKVGEEASTANNGPNAGGTGSFHLSGDSGISQGNLNGGNYAGVAINSRPILQTAASNDKFGIPLGYLIPALAGGRKIPLFLFKDYRLHIEVEFHGARNWVNDITRTANNLIPAADSDVSYSDVELLIDYILPPAAVMNADEAASAQQGGYRMEFENYVLIKKKLPAVGTARELQEVEHRLGLNGRECHKIIQMKQYETVDSSYFVITNPIHGVNDEEYNLEVNGVKLYQDFKFNNADQFNQVNMALGIPLYVPRSMYFSDDNTLFCELASFESGLQANYKPLMVDMKNGNAGVVGAGTIINNHPVVFQYRRRPCSNAATNPDFKRAMDVSYYCGLSRFVNVTSTPKGSNVVVSY